LTSDTYRFEMGSFECTVVTDGTFAYHHPAHVLFTNAPREALNHALKAHRIEPESWEAYVSPYPSLVVNTGTHVVLVDTGAGSLAPTTGKLMRNLQSAGVGVEDVDTVIFTHAHPDHVGGAIDSEGRPAFHQARYVMCHDEWAFWMNDPHVAHLAIPDELKAVILEFPARCLPPLQDQLDLIAPGTEIVPGIRAIAAPGHTPGHIALSITSDGERLLALADTVLHPVHVAHPDWYAAVDYDPQQVVATRQRLLQRAAADEALAFAFHFVFPSLGHVVRHEDGYGWQPLDVKVGTGV
jgi:glyoxylase-like metal-dependent hydrolase (beta-lactamase superfamily II)